MPYQIKLHNFEGPFDLLLHLIEKAEIDIYDIPVAEITNQYLEYIYEMRSLDLDVASEFIVMAATLIQIKSRMLLPKEPNPLDELSADEDDPRAELVEQLLQYKKYKEAAEVLKEKEDKYINIFYKNAEIIDDIEEDKLFMNLSLGDLVNAFNEVLKKYKENNVISNLEHKIIREEITVDDKMVIIRQLLKEDKRIYFSSLFADVMDKLDIIITFLAILELVKLREISVFQSKPYEQILIQSTDSGV